MQKENKIENQTQSKNFPSPLGGEKEKGLEILSAFEPITLEEMESVKLMDRTDSKYSFSTEHLPGILNGMKNNYRLLEINSIRLHRYESLYFDTPDFRFYHKHQNGKLNRYKLRFRKYVDSNGLSFFEIKFKNNKARTIKERVKVKEIPMAISNSDKAENFLKEITPFEAAMFEPKLWANYSRMTFVNKFSPERLTIDVNLHFASPLSPLSRGRGDGGEAIHFPKLVIAEAKQSKTDHNSPFMRMVRKHFIREGGISKYCFGIFSMYDEVKKNNFKPSVRYIHKTMNNHLALTGT